MVTDGYLVLRRKEHGPTRQSFLYASLAKDSMNKEILAWYQEHGRDLPWRRTTDPYKILVSEVMLQQTQVDRVVPKYHSFLAQFPTIGSLASASRADVIKEWSGLGYNRRAVYLHEFAKAIVERGAWPTTPDEFAKLPGIGPYTSKSVLIFAYNADEIVVEANIRRIYLRLFLGDPKANPSKDIGLLAKRHLPKGNSRDWYNALMDFGSMVCTAKSPSCESCPVSKRCVSGKKMTKDEMRRIASSTFKTTQSKFEGSNRWYRSKIVKLLQEEKQLSVASLGKRIKEDFAPGEREWLQGIVDSLVRDGLIVKKERKIRLSE